MKNNQIFLRGLSNSLKSPCLLDYDMLNSPVVVSGYINANWIFDSLEGQCYKHYGMLIYNTCFYIYYGLLD